MELGAVGLDQAAERGLVVTGRRESSIGIVSHQWMIADPVARPPARPSRGRQSMSSATARGPNLQTWSNTSHPRNQ
jgi:hypothetical protein